jgi:chemotaxis protein methyltransferase CheR
VSALVTTPALGLPSATRSISQHEFDLLRQLVHRESGIHLSDAKKALLSGRLWPRLRELRLDSFEAYHRHVTEVDPGELVHMLDCISTNETRFFREPQQFEFLEKQVIPELRAEAEAGQRARRLRIWSAASSSGEEAYSLAMTLLTHLPPESGWNVEIFGSDISTRVLAKARAAIWPIERSSEIPDRYLKRYMLKGKGAQEGTMKASPDLRSIVRFDRINLTSDDFAPLGRFDLILCRNVLIYFDAPTKERVVKGLLARLEPRGLLLLGHAEGMLTMQDRLRRVGPTAYEPTTAA